MPCCVSSRTSKNHEMQGIWTPLEVVQVGTAHMALKTVREWGVFPGGFGGLRRVQESVLWIRFKSRKAAGPCQQAENSARRLQNPGRRGSLSEQQQGRQGGAEASAECRCSG